MLNIRPVACAVCSPEDMGATMTEMHGMKRVVIALAFLGAVGLGGCQSDEDKSMYIAPKPLDQMSTEEWCAFYAKYVADPKTSPKNKDADRARMRARGCPMAG